MARAKLYQANPDDPKPATGYRVVIGSPAALAKYGAGLFEVMFAAAVAGLDGMRADVFGSATCDPLPGEFRAREMALPCAPQFRGLVALQWQRW